MKRIDPKTEEVVGVRCRQCHEVIVDERISQELMSTGGFPVLTIYLLVNGGIHMLTCRRHKMN